MKSRSNRKQSETHAANEAPQHACDSDRVVMGLLYLLVRVSTRGACAGMTYAIGQHLEMLAAHRDASPRLRATSLALRNHWMRYCAEDSTPPSNPCAAVKPDALH